ncbi:hypothetical protein, partial [Pseudomonas aeruginosa]|uniref:hypothetical protein n=1 Tax=Pseudomonas aeruginosa TaxID=287 RepID=UPI002B40B620
PSWPTLTDTKQSRNTPVHSTGLPEGLPKDLGKDMKDFLEKCFKRDPAQRPSAEELLGHEWFAEFSARESTQQ